MREMTATEMENVLASANWATICTASPDGAPYAIEATPFRDDGDICFMINPRGGVYRNLAKNPAILLKFTRVGRDLSGWAGVSCMGTGRFDGNPEAVRRGFAALGRIMKADYAEAARKHSRDPERSPLLRVTVQKTTGRCGGASKATAQETISERTERAAR